MSIRFTNNDSVERTSNLPNLANSTAIWWARRQVDTNNYSTQFGWEDGGDFAINQTDSDGDTLLYWSNNDSALGFTPAVTMANGLWRVTAMTFDASKIYAGRTKLLAATTWATAAGTVATSAMTTPAAMLVGDFFGGEDFDGDIALLKIWSAQLTAEEIEIEALRMSPARLADLWAFYPMYPGADRLRDHGPNGYDLSVVAGSTLADADMPPVPWGGRAAIIQQSAAAAGPDREITADFQLDAPDLDATVRPIAKADATLALDAPDLTGILAAIAKTGLDIQLDAPDLAATIGLQNDIVAAFALDPPDLVATLDVIGTPIVADFVLDAPDLAVTLVTRVDIIASLALDGPGLIGGLNAPAKVIGDMQLDAPDLVATIGGASLITASFDLDAPDLAAIVRPVAGTVGAFGLDAPDLEASLAGIAGVDLDAALEAPDLSATITGSVPRAITAVFALEAPDLAAQLAAVAGAGMSAQLEAPDLSAEMKVQSRVTGNMSLEAPDMFVQIGEPPVPLTQLVQILGTTPAQYRRYGDEGRIERMRFRDQLELTPEALQQLDTYDDGRPGKSYIVLDPILAGLTLTSNAADPGQAIPAGAFSQAQVEADATFMFNLTVEAASEGLLLVLGSGSLGGVTLGVKPDLNRFCLAIGDDTFHAELIHPTRFEALQIVIAISPAQSRIKVWQGQYEAMFIKTPITQWQDPAGAGGFWRNMPDFVNCDPPDDLPNTAASPATVPANLSYYEGQLPFSF